MFDRPIVKLTTDVLHIHEAYMGTPRILTDSECELFAQFISTNRGTWFQAPSLVDLLNIAGVIGSGRYKHIVSGGAAGSITSEGVISSENFLFRPPVDLDQYEEPSQLRGALNYTSGNYAGAPYTAVFEVDLDTDVPLLLKKAHTLGFIEVVLFCNFIKPRVNTKVLIEEAPVRINKIRNVGRLTRIVF